MKPLYYYFLPSVILLSLSGLSMSCLNDGDEANFVGPNLCEVSGSCNERGTCDATSGSVVCSCDLGFSGDHCLSCDTGYHSTNDASCTADEDCAGSDPCENGTCIEAEGTIDCVCTAGWSGETCNRCAAGWHEEAGDCLLDHQCIETTCSGAAAEESCDDSGGVISCVCNSEYAGTFCDACNTAHHRDAAGACVADDDCALADPCANGTCDAPGGIYSCACDAGWAGELCDSCALGFHDEAGDCVLVECLTDSDCDDSLFCNGAETCDNDDLCVLGTAVTCSGNGVCNEGTELCDCTGGATGADCSTVPALPVVSNLVVNCSEDPNCFATAGAVYSETFDVSPSIGANCTISFTPNDFDTGLGIFVLDEASSTQTFTWATGTQARSITIAVQCSNAAGSSNTASVSANVFEI